jgi:hypothetical protein
MPRFDGVVTQQERRNVLRNINERRRDMKRIIITGAALLTIVPASLGLISKVSFAQAAPVSVASQTSSVDDKGGLRVHAEPGDDKGGLRANVQPGDDKGGLRVHAEPGDDHGGLRIHAEPGDDKGGLRVHAEPGDDRGGLRVSTQRGDDKGGLRAQAQSSDDKGGGRGGKDDGPGHK